MHNTHMYSVLILHTSTQNNFKFHNCFHNQNLSYGISPVNKYYKHLIVCERKQLMPPDVYHFCGITIRKFNSCFQEDHSHKGGVQPTQDWPTL